MPHATVNRLATDAQTSGSITWHNVDPFATAPVSQKESPARPGPNRQPSKSCIRPPQTFDTPKPHERRLWQSVPDVETFEYTSPAPPTNPVRRESPNKKVSNAPTFALNRSVSMDPCRPALRRLPTPFHGPIGADTDDDKMSIKSAFEHLCSTQDVHMQLEAFLARLSDIIGEEARRKYLSIPRLFALHAQDPLENSNGYVFDEPLSTACALAPCLAFFAEDQHCIPLVVFAVVEELYARGMDTPGLFRLHGDHKRVDQLVHTFNTGPYGEDYPVEHEAVPDLCDLLTEFLGRLPEPILDATVEKAFFSLVVCGKGGGHTPDNRVRIAQILLRLLPAPNLSLLIYLLSFLSHLRGTAGLSLDALAKLFGAYIAMRSVQGDVETEEVKRAQRNAEQDAREIVKWLLFNWAAVMDGLLDEPILHVDPFTFAGAAGTESRPVTARNTASVPPTCQKNTPAPAAPQQAPTPSSSRQNRIIASQQAHIATLTKALNSFSDRISSISKHIEVGVSTDLKMVIQATMEEVKEARDQNKLARATIGDEIAAAGGAADGSTTSQMQEVLGRLSKVEAEKAKLEKKLKAAQSALTAALSA